ncbi:hypothetical protein G7Y89_g12127 [Cudoniella acicularis]|uniref:CPAF-like PDZ domain-containing protein n=1 Tax=Cudoniella acicularis TaxID=354080 RepID=A0A8H4VXB8_9HELO|nr:hypothetical protein G7Y89_g12127 [Cudoniella acicularis]
MHHKISAVLFLWLSISLLWVEASAQLNNPGSVCSRIQDLQHSAQTASPMNTPVAIPIKATLDCLQNITFPSAVSQMLNDMSPYLDWQTDLADLSRPPSEYAYLPHDLKARLAEVKDRVSKNLYRNNHEFEVDMFEKVFAPAHSGHLIWYPSLLYNPFSWSRRVSLVSISSNRTELPERIFFYRDIISSPSTASPLTLINGVAAAKFLEDLVFATASQDPDAGYNAMFYSKPQLAAKISNGGYFAGGGRPNMIYPGENTTYTFRNGTIVTYDNVALLKYDFSGANTNDIFQSRYGAQGTSSGKVTFPFDSAGYPTPVVTSKDKVISGYYLADGLEDTAVLSVLSFEPSSVAEFQAVAQTFLADAVRDGKTKLVVDLSANNGGYILSGYDLFRQIFPQTQQIDYTRYRENDLLLAYAKGFAQLGDLDPSTASRAEIIARQNSYDYRYDLDKTGQHFPSYEAKFNPNPYKGSNFTALQRWDLDNPLTTTDTTYGFGIEITGYGSRNNFTQPFAAKDVIMLSDGFCASTCGLFSDFMRNQGGVKSIVMGGRPSKRPMQAVGGVRGGLLITWSGLKSEYQRVVRGLSNFGSSLQPPDSAWSRASKAGLNIRDVILPNHVDDGLPAQFIVENADCRLFYTRDMILDVVNIWKAAAKAAFRGASCVVGGLPQPTAQSKMNSRPFQNGPPAQRPKAVEFTKETVTKDEAWLSRHGRKAFE